MVPTWSVASSTPRLDVLPLSVRFIIPLIHRFQRNSRYSSSQGTWITENNRRRSNVLQY